MLIKEEIKLKTFYVFGDQWLFYTTDFCEIHTHYSISKGVKIEVLGPITENITYKNFFHTRELVLNDFSLDRISEFKGL